MLYSKDLNMNIKYLETVTSTNDYIKNNPTEFFHLAAVYSLNQTAGRGRRGRAWEGGGSIALSFLVNKSQNPLLVPLKAALAVIKALKTEKLSVKWPNDIILNNKKLAGILCEGVERGYIVGIGINNSQIAEDFISAELPHATSFLIEKREALNPQTTVEDIVKEFLALCDITDGELISEYKKYCLNIGKQVKIIKGDEELVATALDIAADGGLIIEYDGKTERVVSGEVSVRGLYGYID